MSQRRKRKAQRAAGKSPSRMSPWKFLSVTLVLLLLATIFAARWMVNYLHSDELRETVEHEISHQLGAPVELAKMDWKGLHMESDSLKGEGDGTLEKIEVTKIKLDVGIDYVKRDIWRISGVEIQTASLLLDTSKGLSTQEFPEKPKKWVDKFLPEGAEVLDAEIFHASLGVQTDTEEYSIGGTRVALQKEDYGYSAELNGGTLLLPFPSLASAELQKAKLRLLNERLVVDFAEISIFDSGRLELDGEVDFNSQSKGYSINGVLDELHCRDLISEDWKQRFRGEVQAKFSVSSELETLLPDIKGTVMIDEGQLTALPVLDTIAKYTGVSDFKRLKFSELRCDFRKRGDALEIYNVYANCDRLMRVEGHVTITGEKLDGTFELGMNPRALRKIPGAEGKVFLRGKEGMSWTTVKIFGTTSNVKEDLKDRLKAAAIGRLLDVFGGGKALEVGEDILEKAGEFNKDDVVDAVKDTLLENSGELLEDQSDDVKKAADILLESLFGGSSKKEK